MFTDTEAFLFMQNIEMQAKYNRQLHAMESAHVSQSEVITLLKSYVGDLSKTNANLIDRLKSAQDEIFDLKEEIVIMDDTIALLTKQNEDLSAQLKALEH